MSRHFTGFVLGGLALLLTPLASSAQFPRPFGLPGAPAFPVPFAPPVVAPLPVYSVLPYTITRALPQYTLYRQYFTPGGTYGGFSQSVPYVYSQPVTPSTAFLPGGGASGRENFLLVEQQNLERAQAAATQAAVLAPAGTARNAAAGGVLDSGAVSDLNPALAPADAKAVASGVALNRLLKEIALAESKGAKGPSAYVPPLLIKDVRFAGSPAADLLNFVRQGALDVPPALGAPALVPVRDELTKDFAAVAQALQAGKAPDAARVGQLNATFMQFEERSAAALKALPDADAKAGRDFLATLGGAIKVLKDGAAVGLVNPDWDTEGLTGADLIRHMTKHKLQFGPAPTGAAESYETMNRNLSTYLFVLTKKK